MSQARYAIAASLVFLLAGSIGWFYVNEAPLRWRAVEQETREIAVAGQPGPAPAPQSPATAQESAPAAPYPLASGKGIDPAIHPPASGADREHRFRAGDLADAGEPGQRARRL